jgi:hypothetical protein
MSYNKLRSKTKKNSRWNYFITTWRCKRRDNPQHGEFFFFSKHTTWDLTLCAKNTSPRTTFLPNVFFSSSCSSIFFFSVHGPSLASRVLTFFLLFFTAAGCNSSYWSCYGCTGTFFYSNNDGEFATVLVLMSAVTSVPYTHTLFLFFFALTTFRVLSFAEQRQMTLQHSHSPMIYIVLSFSTAVAPRVFLKFLKITFQHSLNARNDRVNK